MDIVYEEDYQSIKIFHNKYECISSVFIHLRLSNNWNVIMFDIQLTKNSMDWEYALQARYN